MKDKKKITLKLKISNISREQAIALVNMLQEMEKFGYSGHSAYVGFFADGDGDFHPKVAHSLHMTKDKLDSYVEKTKIYEKGHRVNSKEKSFPWTDSITLFDFDNLIKPF